MWFITMVEHDFRYVFGYFSTIALYSSRENHSRSNNGIKLSLKFESCEFHSKS